MVKALLGRNGEFYVTVGHVTRAAGILNCWLKALAFYSASALLAMQSAVLARGIPSVRPSVCLSVCLSVRHVPVLCPDE